MRVGGRISLNLREGAMHSVAEYGVNERSKILEEGKSIEYYSSINKRILTLWLKNKRSSMCGKRPSTCEDQLNVEKCKTTHQTRVSAAHSLLFLLTHSSLKQHGSTSQRMNVMSQIIELKNLENYSLIIDERRLTSVAQRRCLAVRMTKPTMAA
jgi:hypothetical protein